MHDDTAVSLPELIGDFVLLRAGRLRLLVPRQEVASIGHLRLRPRESAEPGLFELSDKDGEHDGGGEYAEGCETGETGETGEHDGHDGRAGIGSRLVVALSEQMEPLAQFPDGRFLLTSFTAHDDILICWDEARVLNQQRLQPRPVPAAMLPPDAPLQAYVEFGDEIAFCCSGERLLAHALAAQVRELEHAGHD